MKIVYISRSIIPSRTANSINVMKMCSMFASLGHEVTLLAPWTKKLEEKNIEDFFEYYGVEKNFKLKKLFSPNIKYLKKKIYSYRCLKEVQRINPDFVYGRNDMFAFYLTQKNGFNTFFEQHEPFRKNDFEHKIFKKFLDIKKEKIKLITISNKLRDIYADRYKINKNDIEVAQSATGLFNNKDLPNVEFSKNKINIGYIGSLFKGRGIETIIELARMFTNLDFHIIGGKKEDIDFWKEKSKGINNLVFYGFINPKETYKYRNMCDILLAPYQGEKAGNRNSDYMSPIKIFEYMASKKAIICSDMPAIRESINEKHAILVKNNSIEEWTKALKSLVDNNEKIKEISENAYEYCKENFTYEARCKKIIKVAKKIVDLNVTKFIGKGTNRSCYVHPENNNLCIKITHSNDYSETIKEIKYYKFLQKREISWEFLAKYYGSVDTSFGKGEVFDLIRDYDGEVSKTLSYYLQNAERTQTILSPLEVLKDLKNYTLNELIVVKDLNTKNMLYQKMSPNEAKLVLIDGVSNNDYLPFSLYIQFFTRRKILRLWKRFENSLPQKYAFNEYFINLLNQKI